MPKQTLAPIVIDGTEYDDLGYCRTPWGGLHSNGPVIHTVYCIRGQGWGDAAVSGSDCIQRGQDGAKIKARRDAADEKRRFTPPEFRQHARQPGSIIEVDRKQRTEILALRGRPRGSNAEWTTWEVYDEPWPDDFLGSVRRSAGKPEPREMSAREAKAIVAEFTERLPHYEFKIVRARLVLDEEQIA